MTSPTTDRAHMTEIDPADLPTLISGHRSALVILTDRPGPEGGTSAGDLVYLRTVSGQVVAAVSVSGPVDRIGRRPGVRWAADLLAAADALQHRLT